MIDEIYPSFLATRKAAGAHQNYPRQAGMYAFFLTNEGKLPDFGYSESLVYIGIAKYSLHDRDFVQHFRSGQSGRSTFRRSLGAILKNQLNLITIPRGGMNDSKRFENYRFTEAGEQALTEWTEENLEIGFWVPTEVLPYAKLADEESNITMKYLPILDLAPKTRRHNKFADKLGALRMVCKLEARDSNED